MKNGLLVCFGSSPWKNIGDYIQSVAQEQFLDNVDCYCERESLDEMQDDDKINLIMNGWFMWNPEHFPPSPSIRPFFISFHLVPLIEKRFFTPQVTEYLKRFEPIGARDIGTQKLLESHGIKSYYSSCLTLTLGYKYKNINKTDEIIFVDPYYEMSGTRKNYRKVTLYFKSLYYILKYGLKVAPLAKNFQMESRTVWSILSKRLGRLVAACHFYNAYKDAFEDDILLNSVSISHTVSKQDYPTHDHMMDYARQLVNRYATAKLVITSRIHCALPCLALETPVLYVASSELESMQLRSPGRMDGIIELFNTLNYDKRVNLPYGWDKITANTHIENKSAYMTFRDQLINAMNIYSRSINKNDY